MVITMEVEQLEVLNAIEMQVTYFDNQIYMLQKEYRQRVKPCSREECYYYSKAREMHCVKSNFVHRCINYKKEEYNGVGGCL